MSTPTSSYVCDTTQYLGRSLDLFRILTGHPWDDWVPQNGETVSSLLGDPLDRRAFENKIRRMASNIGFSRKEQLSKVVNDFMTATPDGTSLALLLQTSFNASHRSRDLPVGSGRGKTRSSRATQEALANRHDQTMTSGFIFTENDEFNERLLVPTHCSVCHDPFRPRQKVFAEKNARDNGKWRHQWQFPTFEMLGRFVEPIKYYPASCRNGGIVDGGVMLLDISRTGLYHQLPGRQGQVTRCTKETCPSDPDDRLESSRDSEEGH